LLLDDVHHLALVGDLLEFNARVVATIVSGCGLEIYNLLSSFDILLEYTSLSLKLIIFGALFLDVTLHLFELRGDVVDSLLGVIVKSLDLVIETLLDIFVLLDVLLHNDFLSLLSDSVELHIHSTLLEIDDFKVLNLALSLMKLQLGLCVKDVSHFGDLLSSLLLNLHVFLLNNVLLNEDGVLVIGGYGQLRDFDLSLLKVDNNFKVELEFLSTVLNFLALAINNVEFILKSVQVSTQVVEVVLELIKSLVVDVTGLLQLNTSFSLRHVLLELSLTDIGRAITVENVLLFFFLNFDGSVNSVFIQLGEGVNFDNIAHFMFTGFFRNLDTSLRETFHYKVNNFTDGKTFSTGNGFDSLLVTLDGCVTADVLLLLGGVVLTVQKVSLFLF
jgi:hypothetical protein